MEIKNSEHLNECLIAAFQYMLSQGIERASNDCFQSKRTYRQKTSTGGKIVTKATVKQLKTKQTFTLDIRLKEELRRD